MLAALNTDAKQQTSFLIEEVLPKVSQAVNEQNASQVLVNLITVYQNINGKNAFSISHDGFKGADFLIQMEANIISKAPAEQQLALRQQMLNQISKEMGPVEKETLSALDASQSLSSVNFDTVAEKHQKKVENYTKIFKICNPRSNDVLKKRLGQLIFIKNFEALIIANEPEHEMRSAIANYKNIMNSDEAKDLVAKLDGHMQAIEACKDNPDELETALALLYDFVDMNQEAINGIVQNTREQFKNDRKHVSSYACELLVQANLRADSSKPSGVAMTLTSDAYSKWKGETVTVDVGKTNEKIFNDYKEQYASNKGGAKEIVSSTKTKIYDTAKGVKEAAKEVGGTFTALKDRFMSKVGARASEQGGPSSDGRKTPPKPGGGH